MYVIAGVTGHVGSVVAQQLLAQGERVRGLVRDAARAEQLREKGAELAVGDLNDEAFLLQALRGARGFFALLPTNYAASDFYADQRRTAEAIARAVAGSGVPHVVLLSSAGAELPEGTGPIRGLHHLEQLLRATGSQLTALRPVNFLDNIAEALGPARQQGIFPNFFASADLPIPMVATRDIGELAARCLLSPGTKHEVVDIVGPLITPRQQAALLGDALGKALTVVDVPEPAWAETLQQAGLSAQLAAVLSELYGWFAHGTLQHVGDRTVQGTRTLRDVLPGVL